MTSAPFDRRLNRVENDVTALYEMIGDIQVVQGQHSADLTRIQAKLLEHDSRFDGVDTRFDAVDTRFDAVDRRFDTIDTRLNTIDGALTQILSRLPDKS